MACLLRPARRRCSGIGPSGLEDPDGASLLKRVLGGPVYPAP